MMRPVLALPTAILLCVIVLMTQLVGVHTHLVIGDLQAAEHLAASGHSQADRHNGEAILHAVTAMDVHHDGGLNLLGHVDIETDEAPVGKIPTPDILGLLLVCLLLLARPTAVGLRSRPQASPPPKNRPWLLLPPSQAPPLSV
ncbi:MAG: hypothetical protein ACPHCJ_02635 [Oceanococcaceae bacterium]